MISEADLVLTVEKWLIAKGLKTNIEIPWIGSHSMKGKVGTRWDLVAWGNNKFMAFEVKKIFSDQAVNQAVAMLPACPEVYLVIWEGSISKALKRWEEVNRDYGIGLISVQEDCCNVLYPAKQVFPARVGVVADMLRVAKLLPREGVEPGYRVLPKEGHWRWAKHEEIKIFYPYRTRAKAN